MELDARGRHAQFASATQGITLHYFCGLRKRVVARLAKELDEVVMFMLPRLRGMTVGDVVMMPGSFDL